MSTELTHRGSIPAAMAWMIGLSAALFWLPGGSLIAGYVGGHKAGSPGRALAAALLPGLLLGFFIFFLGALLGWIPILGQIFALLAKMGAFMLSFMNIVPLLIGAVLGGWMRSRSDR